MMTLQAFKDSAVYNHNFSDHYQDGWFDESTSNEGFLYFDGAFWIAKETNGRWWTLVGYEEMESVNLHEVEAWLYNEVRIEFWGGEA